MSGKKRVLLIGINYIGSSCELHGCGNDITNMREYLESNAGPLDVAQVRTLTDCPVYLRGSATPIPNRENVLAALKWLVEGCAPGDHLFLHYSGHGTQVPDEGHDEISKLDDAIVPVDYQTAGLITDDELHTILVDGVPTGAHLTAIMDCCHSGTVLDLPHIVRGKDAEEAALKQEGGVSHAHIVMISGCRDDQTSADAWEDNVFTRKMQGQGALTSGLLHVLKEAPARGCVEQLMCLRERLIAHNYIQIPQMASDDTLDPTAPIRLL